MSLPGKDLKQTIPHEIHAVLKAYAETHDMELREVVIRVLGDWTDRQIAKTTLMHHALVRDNVISDKVGTGTTVRRPRVIGEAD